MGCIFLRKSLERIRFWHVKATKSRQSKRIAVGSNVGVRKVGKKGGDGPKKSDTEFSGGEAWRGR